MRAINIDWDVSLEEIFEFFDCISLERASKIIEVPLSQWSNMTESEQNDYIADAIHHCPNIVYEWLNIPDTVELPKGFFDDDEITEYLSDEYGWFVKGYNLYVDDTILLEVSKIPTEALKNSQIEFTKDVTNTKIIENILQFCKENNCFRPELEYELFVYITLDEESNNNENLFKFYDAIGIKGE